MVAPVIGKQLLYLSESDVLSVMPSAGAVADQIAQLASARRAGLVRAYPKAVIGGDETATFFIMPALMQGGLAGMKWLGGAPGNPAHGIPAFLGTTTLNDAETGAPVAIMGAAATTVVRTAALSLLAARRLASPQSRTLGLIGAGRQAVAHMQAMREHFPIDQVLVSSLGDTSADFCTRWSDAGLSIRAASTDEVLAQSDIVISAVAADPSLVPFLDGRLMKPRAFASMPDLGKPWTLDGLVGFAAVYTDDVTASVARGGSVAQMKAVTYAGDIDDLADVNAFPHEVDGRSAFPFAGTPIADFAIALLVYEAAVARHVGNLLPL